MSEQCFNDPEDTVEYLVPQSERDEAVRQRDELRAILAPILEHPYVMQLCRVCLSHRSVAHSPDCPVHPANRDALLGRERERAPAHPEGDAT